MQLTLRQAHKLVEKINGRMTKININPKRELSIWTAAGTGMPALTAEFSKELDRHTKLTAIRHSIRDGIRTANHAEVDQLVSHRKFVLDQLGTLRSLVSQVVVDQIYTPEALDTKVAAMKQAASGGGAIYSRDTVAICTVSADYLTELNATIDSLQLKVEGIEDQLTEANSSRVYKVTLSAADVDVLRSENLLALG